MTTLLSVDNRFDQAKEYYSHGLFDSARALCDTIILVHPDHARALHMRATLYFSKDLTAEEKNYEKALELINQSLALDPKNTTFYNKAALLTEMQRFDEALASLNDALALQPDDLEALLDRAKILRLLKRPEEALADYDKAIVLAPENMGLHLNRALLLRTLKQYEKALLYFDKIIAFKPDMAEAHNNRGLVLYDLKRIEEAVLALDAAIRINPEYAECYNNRGVALRDLKRYEAALADFDHAIRLNPDFATAYNNRGIAYRHRGNLDKAMEDFERTIRISPDIVDAIVNIGVCQMDYCRFAEALENFEKALAINPDHPNANWSKAHTLLVLGDYAEGWRYYEKGRGETSNTRSSKMPQPLWLGEESLRGKSIMLHWEQGLGDTIQFCRYVKLVADLGAEIYLQVQKPLMGLLHQLEGVAHWVPAGEPLRLTDYHCPLMSLPLALKTTVETIPFPHSYLKANERRCEHWRNKLKKYPRPLIGLAWSGNTDHQNDRYRSIPLAQLVKHLPDTCYYVSLQKDIRESDEESFFNSPNIVHFGDSMDDFNDTAALCESVDLVISVDTSIAHLAGALGKKVWVMLPGAPDFRWLLDREDSPWYSSATLYRQKTRGQWDDVLKRIATDLVKEFSPLKHAKKAVSKKLK